MSEKYKIRDKERPHFLTLTIVGWIDVFTRKNYKLTIINSLKHCQKEKGLVLFGYCLMPSHLHLIASVRGIYTLSEIMRDFKKFTSKAILHQIQEEPESRREWLLRYFSEKAEKIRRNKDYKFWQDGIHAIEIFSSGFFREKLDYIHNNPVEDLIVEKPEEYLFSSARNYAGLENYLEIVQEIRPIISY
jgi:REP element-mobilizing transposase RayT